VAAAPSWAGVAADAARLMRDQDIGSVRDTEQRKLVGMLKPIVISRCG